MQEPVKENNNLIDEDILKENESISRDNQTEKSALAENSKIKEPDQLQSADEKIMVNKKEYEKLQNDAKDYYNKMLRAIAELENYKKRVQKEKEQYLKFSQENIIKEIINVYENFNRALFYSDDKKEDVKIDKIIEGIKMIQQQILNILEKNGVEEIKIEDKKFNPNFHNAIKVVESDMDDDMIVEELQKGYKMFDKVLIPSMVVVSKKKAN